MTNIEFYTDYMIWGDHAAINAIEKISEDEYRKSFGDLAGSIATKAGHLVGIIEYFVEAINGNPYDSFPSFADLSKDDLIVKWKELLDTWKNIVNTKQGTYFEMPIAEGNIVTIELIFADALFHTIHHRAQILSFLRILGKGKDVIHPRDVNVDFINYLYKKQNQVILKIPTKVEEQVISN
ncbi:MAG: hypothetical protein GPJ54_01495 [Candidatus Heimdallarchaeota archaeon]|nr:hypothetical protein [Candidatus Heimdallarchaeota archaeon]